jgi:kinesin family protein 3/17
LEIYNEEVHDLLADCSKRLEVKESMEYGVFVKDLTLNLVKGVKDMESLMMRGQENRKVGET